MERLTSLRLGSIATCAFVVWAPPMAGVALGAAMGGLAADDPAVVGYYAQPAVHGNTLVFMSGGDLWVTRVPAEGERAVAQRLTSAAGVEARPMISPDGTRVAYAASFDGNSEVFVMPVAGGAPRRLTFSPARDAPVAWTPAGDALLIRSDRASPHSEAEFFTVPASGGPVQPLPFGRATLGAFHPRTGELAFLPYSNETWYWKGYRGGTAPDVWVTDRDFKQYRRVTQTDSNELFPMWVGDRLWFLADDDGRMNLWSCKPDGTDRTKHTKAGPADFDLRWASVDASGAPVIAYAQGAALHLFDTRTGRSHALDIALQGDRLDARSRVERAGPTTTQVALSSDGKRMAIVSRGEVLVGPVGKPEVGVPQSWIQVPGLSGSREAGVTWLSDGRLLMTSDQGGEASLVVVDTDALGKPDGGAPGVLLKGDRWLFAPVASPDRTQIAYGDKSLRMMVMDAASRQVRVAGTSPAGEVVDYRFSPDGRWLAWVATLGNGMGQVHVYDTRTGTDHVVSTGMTDDRWPRWDPKGQYLYFASARAINPELDQFDMAFVTRDAWVMMAVPLKASVAPPLVAEAAAAGLDLAKWAAPGEATAAEGGGSGGGASAEGAGAGAMTAGAAKSAVPAVEIDFDGFMARAVQLPVEPGTFRDVHAVPGGLVYLRVPQKGVADEEWPPPPLGTSGATLEKLDLVKGEAGKLVEEPVNAATIAADGSAVAFATSTPGGGAAGAAGPTIRVVPLAGGEAETVPTGALTLDVDVAGEWAQIFDEAWRLQRDFFYKPDMGGVDWPAVRARYAALLPRVGSRGELNDLVGEMSGELGTSHSYIGGGDMYEDPAGASVGTLAVNVEPVQKGFRIAAILPGAEAFGGESSPLAAPHRGVKVGDTIVSVDGRNAAGLGELGELLVGRAGRNVALGIEGADGKVRVVQVTAMGDDTPNRYAQWVEANRRVVSERSQGRLGYMHLPDMDSAGLTAFVREFYPQVSKDGLVVDERWNGGGYVSQMVLERLRRRAIAGGTQREGEPSTYPARVPTGPMAVLINESAGSDGDIFPNGFRLYGLGPLIGTRTWGGVVGIRGDKPFMDGGAATQPEFAWWDPVLGFGLEGKGVVPDIVVERTPADVAAGRDPQLDRAIAELMPKLGKDAPPKPPVPGKNNTSPPPAAR